MKKIMIILLAGLMLISCKKDEFQVMEREESRSEKASINRQIRELEESLKRAEDDTERSGIYSRTAELHSEKGDILSALDSAVEAVRYDPDNYMARYLLGKSYVEAGRYDEAVTELRLSISYNDRFAPSHFELGNAFYKKYMFPGAMNHYRAAIRLDPKQLRAYNNLGVLLSAAGNLEEAEKSFKKMIEIDPCFAVAYKNLGIFYDIRLEDKEQAAFNYKKFLELAPDSPDRRLVRAWLQAAGG